MTDQLTPEQAERCARALGWKSLSGAISAGWFKAPEDSEAYYSDSYFYQKDGRILEVPKLTRDPYFWFPRLWELRKELANRKFGFASTEPRRELVRDCIALCGEIEEPGQGDSPCEALCAAIEMLTAAKR